MRHGCKKMNFLEVPFWGFRGRKECLLYAFKYLHLSILFLIFTFTGTGSYGSDMTDSITHTKSKVEIQSRKFDPTIIEQFKLDDDFIYGMPPEARQSFLKTLFRRVFDWLVMILGNRGIAWFVFGILIIIGAVGIGFAIYGIFGIGKTIPVYGSEKEGLDYSVNDENIHEINFGEEIESSVNQKDYRKAIRLLYLSALKLLSDKQIIDWQPAKTNHDYLYEIQSKDFQKYFSKLSYFFENVWYGDYQADLMQYKEMNQTFSGLKENLKGHDEN